MDDQPDGDDAGSTPSRAPPPVSSAPRDPGRTRTVLDGAFASAVAYVRLFGRSAIASRVARGATENDNHHVETDPVHNSDPDLPTGEAVPSVDTVAILAERIVAAHRPGHGLQIVGTSLGDPAGATLTDLGRRLSARGRSIIVDLNRAPAKLAAMIGPEAGGRATLMTMPGLAELLAGTSSFADVIHRDHASRLHFIPTGMLDADFRDFDLVLDALAETYDFIMLLAPAFPQSEIAKVMAPYADVVVLASDPDADDVVLAKLEDELIEAGARDVLLAARAGRPSEGMRDVA